MLVNAVSSGLTGLLLIFDASLFAEWFGVARTAPFVWVGAFMVLFAAEVWLIGRQNPVKPAMVQLIIVMDASWVAVSLAIVVMQLFSLTAVGYVLITAVALWVAAMAWLQNKALKQLEIA